MTVSDNIKSIASGLLRASEAVKTWSMADFIFDCFSRFSVNSPLNRKRFLTCGSSPLSFAQTSSDFPRISALRVLRVLNFSSSSFLRFLNLVDNLDSSVRIFLSDKCLIALHNRSNNLCSEFGVIAFEVTSIIVVAASFVPGVTFSRFPATNPTDNSSGD